MANVANMTKSLIQAYFLCTSILHLIQPNKVCCVLICMFFPNSIIGQSASATVNICILIKPQNKHNCEPVIEYTMGMIYIIVIFTLETQTASC